VGPISIAGISAGIAAVAVLVDRKFLRPTSEEEGKPTTETSQSTQEAPKSEAQAGWFDGVKDRLFGKPNYEVAQLFQTWASENIEDSGLREWIASLSLDQVKALTDELTVFCQSLGFELSWLLNKELDQNPELKGTVKETVVSYCMACWQAAQAQTDLDVFKIYQAIINNPSSRESRTHAPVLFTELVKREIVSPMPPDLVTGAKKDQHDYIVTTIREAGDKDTKTVYSVLEEILQRPPKNSGESTVSKTVTSWFGKGKSASQEQPTSTPQQGAPVAAEAS